MPPQEDLADTRESRGLSCPACDKGLLKATRTYSVGGSSRVRRVKCDNCKAVFPVLIAIVEGTTPDGLANGLKTGKCRPVVERGIGSKLRFRL